MKKFLFFFVFVVLLHAEAKKRIFILHSYSQEYSWTKLQHDGFVAELEKKLSIPLEISTEYLDTKRVSFDPSYKSFFAEYLRTKYSGYTPDIIYVTDDNALSFCMDRKSSLFLEVPVVFSGVNDLSLSGKIDTDRYTGVFENKEIEPNIELIRQFSPQTRDIWIVGDDSSTYRSIETTIRQSLSEYPNHRFHFIASKSLENIIDRLPNRPRSFVILTTIGGFTDHFGNTLTLSESIARIRSNANLILMSMEEGYVVDGVIGGFVTSGTRQGEESARIVAEYLRGTPIHVLKPIVKSPNLYVFDKSALNQSRVVLSEYVARQSVLLHQERTFFEQYQELLLNMVFIVLIFLFVFLIFIFFIHVEKKRELKELMQKYEDERAKTKHCEDQYTLIEGSFGNGYWEWDGVMDRIELTRGLCQMLKTEKVSMNFDEWVDFVYPKDRIQVKKTMEEVADTRVFKNMRHKMVTESGTIIEVIHLIHTEELENGAFRVIGMVHIENI